VVVLYAGRGLSWTVVALALLGAGCGRLGYDAALIGDDDAGDVADAPEVITDDGGVDAPVVPPGDDGGIDGGLLLDAALPDAALPDAAMLPGEVVVASGSSYSRRPSVAWTGSTFLVVYDEDPSASDREVFLRAVAPDGTLGAGPVALTASAGISTSPAAVWNGSSLAVAWEDYASGKSQIVFGRFTAAGAPLGQVQLSNAIQLAYNPTIVWTGSEHGVAWDDGKQNYSDVFFARVDAAGGTVGTPLQRTSNTGISIRSSLAWTGSAYGMAWEDSESGVYEVQFARASSAGAALGNIVNVTSNGADAYDVSLAWNGASYGLLWADAASGTYVVLFQRLDATGTPLGAPAAVSPPGGDARKTRMVWAGDRFALVFVQNDRVWFAELNADGSVRRAPVEIGAASAPADTSVSLVWAGAIYGVAWSDIRSGTADVYFTAVTR
jgi:hypothetical protein